MLHVHDVGEFLAVSHAFDTCHPFCACRAAFLFTMQWTCLKSKSLCNMLIRGYGYLHHAVSATASPSLIAKLRRDSLNRATSSCQISSINSHLCHRVGIRNYSQVRANQRDLAIRQSTAGKSRWCRCMAVKCAHAYASGVLQYRGRTMFSLAD